MSIRFTRPFGFRLQRPFTITETVLGRIRHSVVAATLWIALTGIASAHSITVGLLVVGEDVDASLAEAVRGFLLAADERDGHATKHRTDISVGLMCNCCRCHEMRRAGRRTVRYVRRADRCRHCHWRRTRGQRRRARVCLGKHGLAAVRTAGWVGQRRRNRRFCVALPARLWRDARLNGGNGLSCGSQARRPQSDRWTVWCPRKHC